MRHRSASEDRLRSGRQSRVLVTLTIVSAGLAAVLLLGGCGSGSGGGDAANAPPPPSPSASAPAPPGSPAPWTSAALTSKSFTQDWETTNGYTCSIKVTMWDQLPKTARTLVTHPASADATIDPTSDYDPSTDVVIPFEITLTNTTKGFDLEDTHVVYRIGSSTRDVKDRVLVESRTLESWDWVGRYEVTPWDVSIHQAATGYERYVGASPQGGPGVTPGWNWPTPLAPGASAIFPGWFVYRNVRTPAEPQGAAWTLDYLSLIAVYFDGLPTSGDYSVMKALGLNGVVGQFTLIY